MPPRVVARGPGTITVERGEVRIPGPQTKRRFQLNRSPAAFEHAIRRLGAASARASRRRSACVIKPPTRAHAIV